jgi:hypothetical protein
MDLMNHQVAVRIVWIRGCVFSIISIVGARNCTAREFRCVTSGECIPETWVCDHEVRLEIVLFEID